MHPCTKREICLEIPEKSCPVVLPRTPWTTPGDTCIYSLALEGADALPLPHLLLDVAHTGILCSCKPASVPYDTGGRLECLCGSFCVSDTVGARMSLSFRAQSLVSQALVKLGNSSHIWMQWFIWWWGGCSSGAWEPVWECSTSLLLVSVPLAGVPSNVGPTLSCGLCLHRPRVVPSLLQPDAAAWWEEATGMFSCIVGVRSWCALPVLQSEVGKMRPSSMCLMLSSVAC